MKTLITRLIVATLLVAPAAARAFTITKWEPNGTPVSTMPGQQEAKDCIPDGAGGAFIVWDDFRAGGKDIYIQRVNGYGMMLWTPDGLAVCTVAGNQIDPRLAPDGAGGVIVVWEDPRSGVSDIYAQRLSAAGVAQWTANGIPVCAAADTQYRPEIISDGAGGAVVVWADFRNGVDSNLYAQRINGLGAAQWAANGAPVCLEPSNQVRCWITTDEAGGVVVAWMDLRSGMWGLYTQRVNGTGTAQWTADGVTIRTGMPSVNLGGLISDGAGGAIMAWSEWVNSAYNQARAQRVNASGAVQWATGGVALCPYSTTSQVGLDVVSDGVGGAIMVWVQVGIAVGGDDIYAQRINAAGAILWNGNGQAVCTADSTQHSPKAVADGSGGAVIAWEDWRSGAGDVFAQRVNALGNVQWGWGGEIVCAADNRQRPSGLVPDGTGGAIVAWDDWRSVVSTDVYAQRVEGRHGYWGHPEPLLSNVTDVPADQGGKVRVNWFPSGRDILNEQTISHYSVWRAASAAAFEAATAAGVPGVQLADVTETFAGPAIRAEETTAGTAFWELVGTQDAVYLEAYSLTVPTGYDSSAAGPATHDYQVIAHAYWSQYLNWPSNVVSGYSVDNLAPPAPLYLTAQRMGNDVQLKWNRVRVKDLKNYAVYRATTTGVSPVPVNLLSSSTDSLLTDTGAPLTTLYYVVTAFDVHANQSAPSNEAFVSGATSVGNTPAITQLTVLQNFPNPFSAGTELQVGLPAPSDVTVEIYDVAGRRVGGMVERGVAAGWRKIPFAGRTEAGAPLASGVYFYRITANGSTITRKMVIAR